MLRKLGRDETPHLPCINPFPYLLVQSDTGGHQSWSQSPEKASNVHDGGEEARESQSTTLRWPRTLMTVSAATAQAESRVLLGVRRSGMLGGAHGHEHNDAGLLRCSFRGETGAYH